MELFRKEMKMHHNAKGVKYPVLGHSENIKPTKANGFNPSGTFTMWQGLQITLFLQPAFKDTQAGLIAVLENVQLRPLVAGKDRGNKAKPYGCLCCLRMAWTGMVDTFISGGAEFEAGCQHSQP